MADPASSSQLCGFCWAMLLFLPSLLHPFYVHNVAPMVKIKIIFIH